MADKIKVRIQTSCVFKYDQTVEMTLEEWAKLKATEERRMEDGDMSPLSSLLNLRDPFDYGNFDDSYLDVVGDDNEPVKPEDYYGQS